MDYYTFMQAMGNFGFPIAVTIFLLVRHEKKLEHLEEEVNHLSKPYPKTDEEEK
ncbi:MULTISPECIES: YvrJ family protein [Pontibacillus]|uniref:YvrJ family protein n=1 Tax=Pontibacillus chungwhensis TaxID=265426 RepID=A0ABY8V064_9BACI|nr:MULTISPECIES: YvrJ family protein [Pontibacillus]MCD5324929.1 YvrJ family protein [Pontibacillus sp. HN14]WIF98888.1 YvrJ family protein [Pontibacillus chungwhensis]